MLSHIRRLILACPPRLHASTSHAYRDNGVIRHLPRCCLAYQPHLGVDAASWWQIRTYEHTCFPRGFTGFETCSYAASSRLFTAPYGQNRLLRPARACTLPPFAANHATTSAVREIKTNRFFAPKSSPLFSSALFAFWLRSSVVSGTSFPPPTLHRHLLTIFQFLSV